MEDSRTARQAIEWELGGYKNPYFWGSRSFKVIDVGTTGKLVSSACYDAASLCLSATVLKLDEPIVVKLRFLRGYPFLMPSFVGNLLTQRHQIASLETTNSRLPYGEKPVSLTWG